jgi:CheY-like chemotaxis protein
VNDEPAGDLDGKRVLTVDDDYRNVFAVAAALEEEGIEVHTAESGKEALKRLQEIAIDFVLMDIMMPEMDGYETMRRIRAIDRFRSLPIIALTAKAMVGDREKCLEAGASDYLSKPIVPHRLLSMIRHWLRVGHHRPSDPHGTSEVS